MIKILVTGATGQLGKEVQKIAKEYNQIEFFFADRKELDLNNLDAIEQQLDKFKPAVIINCAAYTAVDKAESEEELADRINHLAVAAIAKWTAKNSVRLLHISTDYVFDGNSPFALLETDSTNPINIYGKTKLAGENACLKYNPESIVIRTSWVFSEFGNNFVKTMIRLMKERDTLNIVNDQIGSPTYAADLATVLLQMTTQENIESGRYHYANEGKTSWFHFAEKIQKIIGTDCKLQPVASSEFITDAIRPKYSLLNCSKIKETLNITIPSFENGLQRCINQLE